MYAIRSYYEIVWSPSDLENAAAEALVSLGQAALPKVVETVRTGFGSSRRGALRALSYNFV